MRYMQLEDSDVFTFAQATPEDMAANKAEVSDYFRHLLAAYNKAVKENGNAWSLFDKEKDKVGKFFMTVNLGAEYIFNPATDKIELYNELKHKNIKSKYSWLYVDKGVDLGHAINTHKAQGSTYKNVFFDTSDLLKHHISDLYNKNEWVTSEGHALIYIPMSRASQSLTVLADTGSNRFYDLEKGPIPASGPSGPGGGLSDTQKTALKNSKFKLTIPAQGDAKNIINDKDQGCKAD